MTLVNVIKSGKMFLMVIEEWRCFTFLNNYYGFEQGINQHSLAKVLRSSDMPNNQTELAASYGITHQTMNNYMRMANMIPELEESVITSIVTKATNISIQ